ncbi:MAG: 23S rRNA (guanosine(2251)-2'-O)-methyltransferase RlmB [Treponema sp.]|nr:23S rRNA (guanosine(2251)-2'-O)-methyltransferase RlmB [Treponema sp.]
MHNEQIVTGFHAIEERLRSVQQAGATIAGETKMSILYTKLGPRIKKILLLAKDLGIACTQTDNAELNRLCQNLSSVAQEHRGIVLRIFGKAENRSNIINFDEWLESFCKLNKSSENANDNVNDNTMNSEGTNNREKKDECTTVVILDSITDVHNVGAILRSCDQFGVNLVILPLSRSANDIEHNEIIARSSAGAVAWVPVTVVPNLVRCVQLLKDAGFWIYGLDAKGEMLNTVDFAKKRVLVMGSEGSGISRLLFEQCDKIVSIPTCGKIDSLNVSVATGVVLYELYRETL